MNIPYLFIYSSIDRHLSGFYFLAIVNNASMNIAIQISLQDLVFNFGGTYLGMEFLSQMVIPHLTFWIIIILFFIAATPFYLLLLFCFFHSTFVYFVK